MTLDKHSAQPPSCGPGSRALAYTYKCAQDYFKFLTTQVVEADAFLSSLKLDTALLHHSPGSRSTWGHRSKEPLEPRHLEAPHLRPVALNGIYN